MQLKNLLFGLLVRYVLFAVAAIFTELQSVFQRLFIFRGKIIDTLTDGALELDHVVL